LDTAISSSATLTQGLKREARRLGFALAGACPAGAPAGLTRFHEWLESGFAGEMRYLPARESAYEHPRHVLDGVRSLLMLALPYRTAEPVVPEAGQGRVSRYAWGHDYHELIWRRLEKLAAWLDAPGCKARGIVDTAPLLEREFAQLAGLGWVGKNTLLLTRELGSWFFLAALLTDVELEYDEPYAADHCGTCTACLDACPTDAFVAPYVLDARKCISYLTIEHKSQIAAELRHGIGDWVFGCDVCQDVCPWNTRANNTAHTAEPALQPANDANPIDVISLFDLEDEAFRRRFRHTPLWRAKRRGLLRNAAIVLGNRPSAAAIPALEKGLNDPEPLVREACAWALERCAVYASHVSVSSTSASGCRPGKSSP
jgi:epoxyqueuosine reductase